MTPEEAIKYLEADKSGVVFNQQARQLGIEALKRLQKCRKAGYKFYCQLMPGETYIPESIGKLPSDEE